MNDKQQFIAELYPAAKKVAQETGMSWELILAQAAQETGWGQRQLQGTNNLFNIKAHGDWDGPVKTFNVWEIEGGKKVWRDEPFRVYDSYEEALRDRVKFLQENSRYAKAGLFEEGTKGNLEREAAALQKAGYATDPHYAESLRTVFNGPTMQGALRQAQILEPENEQSAPKQTLLPLSQTNAAATVVGSHSIYDEANEHFFKSGQRFEYGRSDLPKPGRDPSRTEQDKDGDGRLGVDCSAFVWRSLKNAGYDVRGTSADNPGFTTSTLFNGNRTTAYAKENFDITSGTDARKPSGPLQPGDILMFKSNDGGGQHVGIFKGYDSQGHIQFIGSQGSTGPAEVTIKPGGYWDGGSQQIVGALRAKPEFQVRSPMHDSQMQTTNTSPNTKEHPRATHSAVDRGASADGVLKLGEKGEEIRQLQDTLNNYGYRDKEGRALREDGGFGDRTKEAVQAYQQAHGLKADGVVGPQTLEALAKSKEAPLLSDPRHPDNAMYQQAVKGMEQLGPQAFKSRQELENAAGATVFEARASGLTRIDHIVQSSNGTGLFAVQGAPNDPAHHRVHLDKVQAAAEPIEKSTAQVQQEVQIQQSQVQQQERERRPMIA